MLSNNDNYWNNYTIADNDNNKYITNKEISLNHINTINRLYPLYIDIFGLLDNHENEIILDYGCGPGNDLLIYKLNSSCKKIIGVDISTKVINMAVKRLKMHNISVTENVNDNSSITLLLVSDKDTKLNISDNKIDYIQSSGVIHHTSNPDNILKELYRVLKPGGILKIMMYHRNSLYVRLVLVLELLRKKINMDVYDYFEKTGRADSGAPIAFLSDNEDFTLRGLNTGFNAKFVNAAFCIADLRSVLDIPSVLYNTNFPEKHKIFLRKISYQVVKEININNYNKLTIEIDRLYEIEINVNNPYYILPLNYEFCGLTDKGYYDNPSNYNLIITSGEFKLKKKLYSFKKEISIKEINNNFINCEIKLRQIYPIYNGYYPGMNAIYKFIKK